MTAKKNESDERSAFSISPSSLKTPKAKMPTKNLPSSQEGTDLKLASFDSFTSTGAAKKKGAITRITVKYDVGFNNAIFLRGEGADLSWDRGVMLKNIKADEWVWETTSSFTTCQFKVLINDRQYELGENHTLACGNSIEYTPHFHSL